MWLVGENFLFFTAEVTIHLHTQLFAGAVKDKAAQTLLVKKEREKKYFDFDM